MLRVHRHEPLHLQRPAPRHNAAKRLGCRSRADACFPEAGPEDASAHVAGRKAVPSEPRAHPLSRSEPRSMTHRCRFGLAPVPALAVLRP